MFSARICLLLLRNQPCSNYSTKDTHQKPKFGELRLTFTCTIHYHYELVLIIKPMHLPKVDLLTSWYYIINQKIIEKSLDIIKWSNVNDKYLIIDIIIMNAISPTSTLCFKIKMNYSLGDCFHQRFSLTL